MSIGTAIATAIALLAAAWMWRRQWLAQPTGPGVLGVAVKAAVGLSTRDTVALATAAGIVLAEPVAARLVELTAWLAGITGLDAAAWAPAGADAVVLALVIAAVLDVVVIGLWRGAMLRPALRHSVIGLLLPALLVAGWPLLTQTATDAAGAIGKVPAPATCAPADLQGDTIAGYGPDRLAVARIIMQVGVEMDVPPRGQVIAVATSMQESGLRTDQVGDGGKAEGPFQQHPHYGSVAQRRDTATAARAFYALLLKVRGWEGLPLWQAAQAVQRSAHPTAYAKREAAAAQVVGAGAGTTCPQGGS